MRQRLILLLTCSIRRRRSAVYALLFQRQHLAAWFLYRHQDLHLRQGKRHKAQILQQSAPGRQRIRRGIDNPLVVDTPANSIAEKQDAQRRVDQKDILYRVILFLATALLWPMPNSRP